MDRAARIRQSRQASEVVCAERPLEHLSRQLEELSRLMVAAQSKLVCVTQQVQIEEAKLSELKTRVLDEERRAQAACVKCRQTQAIELVSQAALRAYTTELSYVTQALEAKKAQLDAHDEQKI